MPQILRGDSIRNDNIALGQVCGAENAVAIAVPGPTPQVENVNLGNGPCPYGIEKILVGVTAPNPEIP
jgi:hypothetical protein